MRLKRIAEAAGLNWRDARSVSGITDDVLDLILARVIQGETPAQIVEALSDVRVTEGYRPARPLIAADVEQVARFLRHVRQRLREVNGRIDRDAEAADRLFESLQEAAG